MYEALAISTELNDLISYVADAYDMRIEPDYSGRGMYGGKCFGLVFEGTVGQFFSAFLQSLSDEDISLKHELADLFDQMQTDSMGRWATIYYFPGWILEEETEDYEDEEEIDEE